MDGVAARAIRDATSCQHTTRLHRFSRETFSFKEKLYQKNKIVFLLAPAKFSFCKKEKVLC